jgi:circadian clock protein KaiC
MSRDTEDEKAQVQPFTPQEQFSLRVPTGIKGFDELISGGLIRGRTFLLAGETGTGKTIFSLRFLLTGVEAREPALYVPFDETIEGTVEGALSLGWDLMEPMQEGLLRILDVRPFFAEVVREKFMAEVVREVVTELKRNADEIGAKRIVVDPVAPLLGEAIDVAWTRDYIRSFVNAIEKFIGATTIITSEIPTGVDALSRFGVEEFLASGIIKLNILSVGFRNLRTITVRKMRWTRVDLTPHVFEIKPIEGVVVGPPVSEYIRSLS